MDKKILAIYYTQSGQMSEIINSFTNPLIESGASVEKVIIEPLVNYNFPWTGKSFFGVMPDCVLSVPTELKPFGLKENKYDLIILGYQPWFLSPSIPSNSLLQHPSFKNILKDTPVITISEARNMWLNAYVRVRSALKEAGANLVGNIALIDKNPNAISFVTIFYWMLTGKKERFLNLFPKPGVAEEDIYNAKDFGEIVVNHLQNNDWQTLQENLLNHKSVVINYSLMFIEGKAKIIFNVWAKIISKRKNKDAWLVAFKYYLFIALFLAAPIGLTIDAIFLKPFMGKRIKRKKEFYLQLN